MKDEIRKHFLEKRKLLSPSRRKEASRQVCETFLSSHKKDMPILSFASFGSEIDLWPLNHYLAEKGCLLLPKVAGDELEVFIVRDIHEELQMHPYGFLEPRFCTKYSGPIETILVPGIAFDESKNRLGLGKGFYDRFLSKHVNAQKIGVGFQEQLTHSLPIESHDEKVDFLYLF